MKIDGACHCGFVAYEAEADPELTGICHCTDCQTLSGSAFRTVVSSRRGSFKLRSGEPKIYVKTAESGTKRQQAFCPNCGTNLCPNCSTGVARPNIGPMISAPYRRLKSNANSATTMTRRNVSYWHVADIQQGRAGDPSKWVSNTGNPVSKDVSG
jgi:hypothetical protein